VQIVLQRKEKEMKKASYLIIGALFITLVLGFTAQSVMAADQMPASAEDVKVLLENDEVRVVEATRKPGTKVPMHTHPRLIAYYFDAAKVKLTSPKGKSTVKNIPAGKLIWYPDGVTHALEVIGTADQHVLVIEIKK
jgi:quercetin dioxygenase-like cupin family protein